MTITLQSWGNSQGVRLPKPLLAALGLQKGASVQLELSAKKDAIIVTPVHGPLPVRGRHRIEDLVATLPKNYRAAEFNWGARGREAW